MRMNERHTAGLHLCETFDYGMECVGLTHQHHDGDERFERIRLLHTHIGNAAAAQVEFTSSRMFEFVVFWFGLVRSLNILFRLFRISVCVRSCCIVDAHLFLALRFTWFLCAGFRKITSVPIHWKHLVSPIERVILNLVLFFLSVFIKSIFI